MGSHVAVLEVGARETSVIRTPLDSRMDGSIVSSRSMPERSRRLYIGLARVSARQYLIITYSYKLETAEVLCVAACCSAPRYVLTFFIFCTFTCVHLFEGQPFFPSAVLGCRLFDRMRERMASPDSPGPFSVQNREWARVQREPGSDLYQSNLEPVPTERKAHAARAQTVTVAPVKGFLGGSVEGGPANF